MGHGFWGPLHGGSVCGGVWRGSRGGLLMDETTAPVVAVEIGDLVLESGQVLEGPALAVDRAT